MTPYDRYMLMTEEEITSLTIEECNAIYESMPPLSYDNECPLYCDNYTEF